MEDANANYELENRFHPPIFHFKSKSEVKKIDGMSEEESSEIKFEHIFQQIINDLYAKVENGEAFNLKNVEKVLLQNCLVKFNRTQTAKLVGISVRTVRNKINSYGLKNVQCNNRVLH